jgi:hypothetical protein
VGGARAHLQGHRVEGRGGAEALRDLVDRDHPCILPPGAVVSQFDRDTR